MAGDAVTGVRAIVRQSWARSLASGLQADAMVPTVKYPAGELAGRRADAAIMRCTDALFGALSSSAPRNEHIVSLCDADGVILRRAGHRPLLTRADAIGIGEGVVWTEESAGTNAAGVALALDQPVQLYAGEHFALAQHDWWCSAVPIHEPVDGAIVGLVALCGLASTADHASLRIAHAGARMAEEVLRLEDEVSQERLRRRFAERTAGLGALALVAADGRVLERREGVQLPKRIAPPAADGSVAQSSVSAVAEPLEGGAGWVLWPATGRTPAAKPTVHLQLLGTAPKVRVDGRDSVGLRLRHAEILAILARHPEGLSTGALAEGLMDAAAPSTIRAEVSRLRRVVGPALTRTPYRLHASLTVDAFEVERALAAGDVERALALYHAPLLGASAAPQVEIWRDELEDALWNACLHGGTRTLVAWTSSPMGRNDSVALTALLERLDPADPQRSVACARLRALN